MDELAVVGAGIVGAFVALQGLDQGYKVTIVEPESPGGRQAASYGNGGWIMEASLAPVAMPGLWKKVPALLFDRAGPLVVRWRHLPRLAPWLLRFLRAGASADRVWTIAVARHQLVAEAASRYTTVAHAAGISAAINRTGHLFAYPDESWFEADSLSWELRRHYGHEPQVLDGAALARMEPGISASYGHAAFLAEGCNLPEPGRFVEALVALAEKRGAVRVPSRALGWRFEGDRLRAVKTDHGDVPCRKAVLAAGIASKQLAAEAGDHIPLESERGYHVIVRDPEYQPRISTMPADGKMVVSAGPLGVRVAGQVELASRGTLPDWRRTEVLLDNLHRLYPAIPRRPDPARVDRWLGHRPSTPDALPVIGQSRRSQDLIYAFGHGHSGITMAPATARLAIRILTGMTTEIDAGPYRASRFT